MSPAPKKIIKKRRGISFIEVLLLLAVASLVSSLILASMTMSRSRARDDQKRLDVAKVSEALHAYYADAGIPVKNYLYFDGSALQFDPTGNGNIPAYENIKDPEGPSHKAYTRSMLDLVEGGYLDAVPHSTSKQPYIYYHGVFYSTLELDQAGREAACAPAEPTVQCEFRPPESPEAHGCTSFYDYPSVFYEDGSMEQQWAHNYVYHVVPKEFHKKALDDHYWVRPAPCGNPFSNQVCSCNYPQ